MENAVKKLLAELALAGVSVKCFKEIEHIIQILETDSKYNEIVLMVKALSLFHREYFTEVVTLISPHIDKFPDLIFMCILASERLNNDLDVDRYIKLANRSNSADAKNFAKEFQEHR